MSVNKFLPIFGLFLATSTVACGPVRARPASMPAPLQLESPVTSCVVTSGARSDIELRDLDWIGRAGDRTWFIANNGSHRALFRLLAGKLESVDLPDAFDEGFVSAYVYEHFIWILRTGTSEKIVSPAWMLVNVANPAKPSFNRLELLDPLSTDEAARFALWSDRALFALGSPGELLLWNLDKATTMGSRVRMDAKDSDIPWMYCGASACLSIIPEGAEAKRQMILHRFDWNGGEQREEIGPGVVAEWMTLRTESRIVTAWSRFDGKGLWARQLNAATGKFEAAPYTMSGVEQDLQDPQAIESRNGPLLAWQAARVGWRLGQLQKDGLGVRNVVTLPAEGSFLSAASTDDGIVAAIYSAGKNEEKGNEWYSSVRALFVPHGKTPKPDDVMTLINDEHSSARGGYGAYAIAAPDSAAVIVTPRGDSPEKSFMRMVRKPCSP